MDRKCKVGIISLYFKNRNYGGLLQAYALQKFISNNGFACEQICYDREPYIINDYLTQIRALYGWHRIKAIWNYGIHQIKSCVFSLICITDRKKLKNRINMFDAFQQSIPHSKAIYTQENIKQSVDQYNTFICGSDVIWNAGVHPYVSCLGFVPDGVKKFAYAPSLGGSELPEGWFEEYEKYITRLHAISVREESIKENINQKNPELVIQTTSDPTFLLSRKDWEAVLPKNEQSEPYVLCYLLGRSIGQRKQITKWSKKNGLKIVTFPYIEHNTYRKCDILFGDIRVFGADPLQFIKLIDGAEMVITDSFHAVVFSLIFHTKFRALNRSNGYKSAEMSGRIQNLLKEVQMEEMLISDDNIAQINNFKIAFEKADQILSQKRELSRKYLLQNIRI